MNKRDFLKWIGAGGAMSGLWNFTAAAEIVKPPLPDPVRRFNNELDRYREAGRKLIPVVEQALPAFKQLCPDKDGFIAASMSLPTWWAPSCVDVSIREAQSMATLAPKVLRLFAKAGFRQFGLKPFSATDGSFRKWFLVRSPVDFTEIELHIYPATSGNCRKVKVGEEIKPIYEIRCMDDDEYQEPPEIPQELMDQAKELREEAEKATGIPNDPDFFIRDGVTDAEVSTHESSGSDVPF